MIKKIFSFSLASSLLAHYPADREGLSISRARPPDLSPMDSKLDRLTHLVNRVRNDHSVIGIAR